MNKCLIKILLIFFLGGFIYAETPKDHAVLVKVSVTEQPVPAFKLSWDYDSTSSAIFINRKMRKEHFWTPLAVLPKDSTSFTDTLIAPGAEYEYFIKKIQDTTLSAFAYLSAGINLPPKQYRGKLLLIVDRTLSDSLKGQLDTFLTDLTGDGWTVRRYDVARTEEFNSTDVATLKKIIDYEYSIPENPVQCLILFGRVAVPYSGATAVDGHFPIHYGAWPADVYYALMDNSWTDFSVFTNTAERSQNWNFPFDGKWDQSFFYDNVRFPVGRIDFYNLPNFKESEIDLYRRYLKKNHAYRNKIINIRKRALLHDGFGMYTAEAPAALAWFNFAALVGPDSIVTQTYFPNMEKDTYLWSYACNQGSYNSMLSTVYTDQLAKKNVNGIFTVYFGSYLPDWDSEDNLLRAAIASNPSLLCSFFGGRPFWHLHHMALGETIGFQTVLTQNNTVEYISSGYNGYKGVHIALMGDPTLRQDVVPPVRNLRLAAKNNLGNFHDEYIYEWDKPDSSEYLAYYVYKSPSFRKKFEKIAEIDTLTFSFRDTVASGEKFYYMVRAVKKEIAVSGSYINMSQGAFIDLQGVLDAGKEQDNSSSGLYPNPADDFIYFIPEKNEELNYIGLYDIFGREVSKIDFNHSSEPSAQMIMLKDNQGRLFPEGIYYLKAEYKNKISSEKFLIIR